MEKLKQFMQKNEIAWNWSVGKAEGLFAWIPYPLMGEFIALPEVE